MPNKFKKILAAFSHFASENLKKVDISILLTNAEILGESEKSIHV